MDIEDSVRSILEKNQRARDDVLQRMSRLTGAFIAGTNDEFVNTSREILGLGPINEGVDNGVQGGDERG